MKLMNIIMPIFFMGVGFWFILSDSIMSNVGYAFVLGGECLLGVNIVEYYYYLKTKEDSRKEDGEA